MALVFPDTSPRGAGIAGEDDSWDFGTGASTMILIMYPVITSHMGCYYIAPPLNWHAHANALVHGTHTHTDA